MGRQILWKAINVLVPVLCMLCSLPATSRAAPIDNWTVRNLTGPSGYNTFLKTTYANGKFFAAGSNGTILASDDGATWSGFSPGTGTTQWLSEVTYGVGTAGGRYVAVGANGTILSYAPGPGSTWQSALFTGSGTTEMLSSVAFGNGMFVAVGSNGVLVTSRDGINWTVDRFFGSTGWLYKVIFDGIGSLVAVGTDGLIWVHNGISWQSHQPTTETLHGVTFGHGMYVAVGNTGIVLTSPDGSVWTRVPSQRVPTTEALLAVAFRTSLNTFAAVGLEGTVIYATSPDVSWSGTTLDAASSDAVTSISSNGNVFVATKNPATGNGVVFTSSTAIPTIWNQVRQSGITSPLSGIAFGNNAFVAVGTDGVILTSPDAVSWSVQDSGTGAWFSGITYARSMFVAVGSGGTILTSSGSPLWAWRSRTTPTTEWLSSVAFGNNMFVAVGTNGTILSWDGVNNWVERTPAPVTTSDLLAVTFGNNTFLAVGLDGTVVTSLNGIDWTTAQPAPLADTLLSATFGKGKFIATGFNGSIYNSPDGTAWTRATSVPAGTSTLFGVAYDNDTFVAVGTNGLIVTSTDGATWTRKATGVSTVTLFATAYGGNTFVAVGDYRTILQSDAFPVEPTTGGGGGGGCFIATAAYGSYLDSHVVVLRDFRDRYLVGNPAGRAFVDFYYSYSPAIAEAIRGNRVLMTGTRCLLTPIVFGIKYPHLPFIILFGILVIVYRRVKGRGGKAFRQQKKGITTS